jgi:hypothetical protein
MYDMEINLCGVGRFSNQILNIECKIADRAIFKIGGLDP